MRIANRERQMATQEQAYTQDGPLAREIAAVIPYFPFKGIPRFYDVGGLLASPTHFQKVVDVMAERYADLKIDAIGGFDARGFLFTPVALALNKPFFMLRKKGKMPNTIYGEQYTKEYAGSDCLGIPRGAVKPGDRVLLIDDLVATGGTLTAGVELVEAQGATVVECACNAARVPLVVGSPASIFSMYVGEAEAEVIQSPLP